MNRLSFALVAGIGAFAILLVRGPDVPGQGAAKLPTVDAKKHMDYVEKLTEHVSIEMAAIPGGTYLMGTPDSEKGREPNEGPQHPVTIQPFWMAKYETTWELYDLYWVKKAGEAKSGVPAADAVVTRKPTPPYADETLRPRPGRGRPAICMTIHAANQFCGLALSACTGKHLLPILPTEAEWEYACRAGTTTTYSFGDDPARSFKDSRLVRRQFGDDHHAQGRLEEGESVGPLFRHCTATSAEWCASILYREGLQEVPDRSAKSRTGRDADEQAVSLRGPRRLLDAGTGEGTERGAELLGQGMAAPRSADPAEHLVEVTDAWTSSGFRVICPVEEIDALKDFRSKITRESADN